jgi:RNA polymerase sigma factor (TIGR02999 family)
MAVRIGVVGEAELARSDDGESTAEPAPVDRLLPLVYAELRRIAAHRFRREPAGHTLQPTAIVHEAYIRLAAQDRAQFESAAQFRGLAAEVIRRVLVDHARTRRSEKRGGGRPPVTLHADLIAASPGEVLDAVDLDEALARLTAADRRAARVVELRFFGGLSEDEVALLMGVTRRTVQKDWAYARAWLRRELAPSSGAP